MHSTESTSTAAERAAAERAERTRARRAKRERRQRERAREQRAATTATPTETAAAPAPAEPSAAAPPSTPKPKPKPNPRAQAGPAVHPVVETASLSLVAKKGISFVQEGSVTGTLNGQMRLHATLAGKGVEGTFTVTLPDGTLTGRASAALTLDKSVARFRGTTTVSRGSGAYAKLVPTELSFSGSVAADASTSTIKLAGDLRY